MNPDLQSALAVMRRCVPDQKICCVENEDRVRNQENGSSFNELECRNEILTEDG